MKLASRIVAAAVAVAVSGVALACTTPFKMTNMPKGTTINKIINLPANFDPNTMTALTPYTGFFVGYQNELFTGLNTGAAATDPTNSIPLMTELGLDGSATTASWTVVVVPDGYMPGFGDSLALYSTVINAQTVQQQVARYAVIPGAKDFRVDDGKIKSYQTLGGYNTFGLHACVGPVGATVGTLTINNSHVLAAYKVDNGIVYVVDGIEIPRI